MASSCKVCGARTAGHRQYCPDCRLNRVRGGGRGYVSSRDQRAFREIVRMFLFIIIWSLTFWVLFIWVTFLGILLFFEFLIKVITLLLKRLKNKIFVINACEKDILELMKKSGKFFISLHPPKEDKRLPAPGRTAFSYR